uniref:CSON013029 protein n=1 Tax=Culicoides sonorensis TaxID=179676 RepID=A0A336M7L3_CULSO
MISIFDPHRSKINLNQSEQNEIYSRSNPVQKRFKNKFMIWFYSQFIASNKHPLAKWYLKSDKAIFCEVERHVYSDFWFIIHPFSNFNLIYTILMTPLSFYLLFINTFSGAFHYDIARCMSCVCLNIEFFISNTIIIIEIILNFFTGCQKGDNIILNQKNISIHYIQTYFLFDLLSGIPTMFILKAMHIDGTSAANHYTNDIIAIRILSVMRFLKYVRVTADLLFPDDLSDKFKALIDQEIPAFNKYLEFVMVLVWHVFANSSNPLRTDIVLQHGKIFMEKVKIFQGISVQVIKSIVSRLTLEIYLPNDMIIKSGDYGSSMFFIGVGTVAVFTQSGKEVAHYEDGDHFGELNFVFQDVKLKENVIAVAYCEIFRLESRHYKETIERAPELRKKLEEHALRRLDMILLEEQRQYQN